MFTLGFTLGAAIIVATLIIRNMFKSINSDMHWFNERLTRVEQSIEEDMSKMNKKLTDIENRKETEQERKK